MPILISSSLSVLHKKDVFSKKLALMKKLLKDGMSIVIEEISFACASEIRAIKSRISQVMGIEKSFEDVFNSRFFLGDSGTNFYDTLYRSKTG
jgi:hypothetical protein